MSSKFLDEWIEGERGLNLVKTLTINAEKELNKSVLKKHYILYRTVYFDAGNKFSKILMDSFEYGKLYNKADNIKLKLHTYTSWTTDLNIAEEFIEEHSAYTYHIIFKMKIESKDVKSYILADITNYSKIFNYSLQYIEDEIILNPGTYKMQIYSLYKNGEEVDSMLDF